jgi:bromodomain-containing factor 1
MASPAPEAVASQDTKSQDSVPAKEVLAEVNGHAASDVEAKPQTEPEAAAPSEKPITNGDKAAEKHQEPNGISSEDVEMKSDDIEEPKVDEVAKSEDQPIEEPIKASESAVTEPASAEDSADVEMTEASATESNALPIQEKADADPSSDTPAAPAVPTADTQEAALPTDEAKDDKDISPAADTKADKASSTKVEEKADASSPAAIVPPATEVDIQPASLSQLAIESKEKDSSPVHQSVEVSMTDASSGKVAREREDDVEGEPAPKRAKTEPKEDEAEADAEAEASYAAPEESTAVASGPASFAEFPRWSDPDDNARPITTYQRRKIRAVIARVKKTKHGGHFRDSVQRLWPMLWDKYSAKIEKSMDLSEIERTLRDNEKTYNNFGEFKKDLGLILENAHTFNGPDHYVTNAARGATKAVWEDVYQIPEEEPAPTKPAPKTNRIRESRSANPPKAETTARADAVAQPASVPANTPAQAAPVPAKPAQPTSESRRASTATDVDRPKRTVRAPKSKDIDYSKSSRKKLKPELQFCEEVLGELMASKNASMNQWFLYPVDAVALGIPDYYSIIKHPMDLTKVSSMLSGGDISSLKDFDKNVRLIFANCYQFNGEPDPSSVSFFGKQLEDLYTSLMKNKDTWIAKHSKPNPPAASNATDDEEDDEDEDDGEEGSSGPDPSREVKDLEARLREEMDKQTNLFAAEQPNESMIQIQQGIVTMVQEALLKAKIKLNEYRQKNGNAPKPSKKAAKAGKAKSSAGAGRKATGAAAQPKKAGGGAKKAKKTLTAADKDQIANAINDLEYPHLDRAIDIIKRDTGSKVGTLSEKHPSVLTMY